MGVLVAALALPTYNTHHTTKPRLVILQQKLRNKGQKLDTSSVKRYNFDMTALIQSFSHLQYIFPTYFMCVLKLA